MTRAADLQRLIRGIGQDMRDYRALHVLLDEQFYAALRHRATALQDLAQRIGVFVDDIEKRRRERVQLVEKLVGRGATMSASFALVTDVRSRALLQNDWQTLETLVVDCKRLNARNGQLMTTQHSIMQRVLRGDEEATYAPV